LGEDDERLDDLASLPVRRGNGRRLDNRDLLPEAFLLDR
jgi:hypothetical protein